MKRKSLSIMLCFAMAVAVLGGCGNQPAKESDAPVAETQAPAKEEPVDTKETEANEPTAATDDVSGKKVILITMDSIDQHWVAVDKGAKTAADEFGLGYAWMAPDKKDDAQQIERVNNAVADGADAIVIAANGPDAVTAALEEAKADGIKIIYIDSPAKAEAEATFSTDNTAAGKTAGEEMIAALNEAGTTEGKIGIIGVNSATTSTVSREEGFRSAFEGTAFELLETQYGEGDTAKSQDIADNYITEQAVGVFATNEGSAIGAGNANKSAGGGIVTVGFDKSDAILSLIDEGYVVCTMAQNPDVMGYEGVKAAAQILKGETISEKEVDTGVSIISKDNLAEFK